MFSRYKLKDKFTDPKHSFKVLVLSGKNLTFGSKKTDVPEVTLIYDRMD